MPLDPQQLQIPPAGAARFRRGRPESVITVGLVNIMPAAARKSTEDMFRRMLLSVAPGLEIDLRIFAPPAPEKSPGESSPGAGYETLEDLWKQPANGQHIDALIVTGTQPCTSSIEQEICWPDLQRLCDWAARHTLSTIWSCFSAHAAVLHMDGIRRHRMDQKIHGVFEARKLLHHPISATLPAQWLVPHSRYHGLAEADLRVSEYQILSHTGPAGVDSFAKRHGSSEFLFLQGHPEYGPEVLFGEYCRDIKRFLAGECAHYPNIPENYLDAETHEAIAALRAPGGRSPHAPLPPQLVKSVTAGLAHRWREPARQLYGGWLSTIAQQKSIQPVDPHAYTN